MGLHAMLTMYGLRDVASTTVSLPEGALMALGLGRPGDAATLMGAFEGLCDRYGVRPPIALARLIKDADPLERDATLPSVRLRSRRRSSEGDG